MTSVTVEASGRVTAHPNKAVVEFVAFGGGASAGGARRVSSDRATALREALSDVRTGEVRTVDIEVNDVNEMFDPEVDDDFLGRERMEVVCDPTTAEEVVLRVTDAGGRVESVQFQLHEEVRQEAENEAAMANARRKAERVAAAESRTIQQLDEITVQGDPDGFDDIVDEALDGDADLAPSPIPVTQTLTAEYLLSDM